MSNLRQAAQQALEALTLSIPKPRPADDDYAELGWKEHNAAITALRAALAEPEQNPFGDDAERYARKLHEERESCKAIFTEHKPQTTHWEGCEAVHPECKVTPRKPVELTDGEILAANYADGEEADPIIAAPDSELIAFSRAVMAVQRDKEGKPIAHWHGLIEPQKDAAAFAPRKPLPEEEIWNTYKNLWMFHPAEEPRLAGDVLKFARAIERAHGIGEQDGS